ncbi:MAG TPA: hypothetical protein VFP52_06865, partial [Myxococcales bacterium]|nr:hypothetical protein [Myxococcales bacterium]
MLSVTIEHVTAGSLRGAVLLLQAGRLRGWRSTGLGDAPAGSIEVPLERPSFVADAIERGVPISTRDAAELAEVFPSLPQPPPNRVGLALPILVGGRAVALLYVDDGNSETPVVPSNWPEQAEILTRHAGRCLEALTLARANGLPQRASQEMR